MSFYVADTTNNTQVLNERHLNTDIVKMAKEVDR